MNSPTQIDETACRASVHYAIAAVIGLLAGIMVGLTCAQKFSHPTSAEPNRPREIWPVHP